jgi:hypothetical protein
MRKTIAVAPVLVAARYSSMGVGFRDTAYATV